MSRPIKLLLFDIDGTLVDTEGAGLLALESGFFGAFPQCVGTPFPPLDLGGATDGSVVEFLFECFNIKDTHKNRGLFFDCYSKKLAVQLDAFGGMGKGRVLPGVADLLKDLTARPEFLLGLLTGNIEDGARLKLKHFGIEHHFQLGAYGCDHSVRDELGRVAIRRASALTGAKILPADVLVIGDTLKDVACARACGAQVLAVGTGGVDAALLKASAPDAYLTDLADTERVLDVLRQLF